MRDSHYAGVGGIALTLQRTRFFLLFFSRKKKEKGRIVCLLMGGNEELMSH